MNRNTIMAIIRYSIVIMLIALAMFFWLDISAPGFVAVSITMVFCILVFSFGLIRLILDEENGLDKKKAAIVFVVYVAVCAVAVAVKLIWSGVL